MLAFCLQRKLQPMPKSVLRRHVNGLTTGRANSEKRLNEMWSCVSEVMHHQVAKKICLFDLSIKAEKFKSRSSSAVL